MKGYRHGQHICVLYDTAEEQRTVAAAYIADGLAYGDRCYYVADSAAALRQFRVALERLGVDVDQVLRSRAFLEATYDDAHLVDGHFDCERMLAMLNHAVETAPNRFFEPTASARRAAQPLELETKLWELRQR